jgi:hypothetical protein
MHNTGYCRLVPHLSKSNGAVHIGCVGAEEFAEEICKQSVPPRWNNYPAVICRAVIRKTVQCGPKERSNAAAGR